MASEIWRRIEMPANIALADLHDVIQATPDFTSPFK
nr:hypothetical protein [Burkholderia stagnalis]